MFCPRCGTESLPDHKFCKNCGAMVGGEAESAQASVAGPALQAVAPGSAAPPPVPPGMVTPPPMGAPPPGMTTVVYQAYPGGPQQVYYVPTASMHPRAQTNFMEGLRSRIRNLASTDSLQGFSLGQMFSEVFKHHGADAVENYFMVGGPKTTPPIELAETGWPKPWMFFRLLALFAIAFAVLCAFWSFTQNVPLISAIMIMGAFGVPLATLLLIFEMNTPRNVSLVVVGKLFVIGGLAGICLVSFEYMKMPGSALAQKLPGIVEETAKFAMVLLVMRSVRYKYELNGILFGAAVGAGFASFETTFYAFQSLLGALGVNSNVAVQAMVHELEMRALLAPFGHVAWTAIAAGAFWRIKQNQPASFAMLQDPRFLKAFAIPVVLHTLWDLSLDIPSLATNTPQNTVINWALEIGTGAVTWYVLFGLIQQGLQQVKEEQKSHLQSTLANVEATLGPGAARVQPAAITPVA